MCQLLLQLPPPHIFSLTLSYQREGLDPNSRLSTPLYRCCMTCQVSPVDCFLHINVIQLLITKRDIQSNKLLYNITTKLSTVYRVPECPNLPCNTVYHVPCSSYSVRKPYLLEALLHLSFLLTVPCSSAIFRTFKKMMFGCIRQIVDIECIQPRLKH